MGGRRNLSGPSLQSRKELSLKLYTGGKYRHNISLFTALEICEPERLPVEKFKKDCKKDKYENMDSDDHNEPHKRMEDALGNPWPTTTAFSREFFFQNLSKI